MDYGYVYLTSNLVNGNVYVGQKKSSVFLPDYLGSGTVIGHAVNKYGRHNFKVELLEFAPDLQSLNEKEIKHIARCRESMGASRVYNIRPGGVGFNSFESCSSPPWKGGHLSDSHRAKLSASVKRKMTGGVLNKIRANAVKAREAFMKVGLRPGQSKSDSPQLAEQRRREAIIAGWQRRLQTCPLH